MSNEVREIGRHLRRIVKNHARGVGIRKKARPMDAVQKILRTFLELKPSDVFFDERKQRRVAIVMDSERGDVIKYMRKIQELRPDGKDLDPRLLRGNAAKVFEALRDEGLNPFVLFVRADNPWTDQCGFCMYVAP